MAELATALRAALILVLWPGMVFASAYTVSRAVGFYRSVSRSAPGLLVLLTVIGWMASLVGVAFVASFYLVGDPAEAAPIVLPVFVLWAGSLVTIVWVMHRWGREAVRLESYYLELEQMDRLKDQFINNVAHELNTPITPLRMQLDLLSRERHGPLSDRQKAALAVVERNVLRLSRIVEQVLLAGQLQARRVEMRPERVALKDLMNGGVEAARSMVRVRDGQLRADCDDGAIAFVDPVLARQAVGMVIAQAVRDTPEGKVHVEAHAEGQECIIRVRDEGVRPGAAERASRTFPQNLAPWTDERGLGLELFLARAIAEAHGGRFWAEGAAEGSVLGCAWPRYVDRS